MGKNSYEYTGINTSATAAFPAGTDLTDIGAKAVALSEEGLFMPEAGAEIVGIVPISEDESYQKGEDVTVQDSGYAQERWHLHRKKAVSSGYRLSMRGRWHRQPIHHNQEGDHT